MQGRSRQVIPMGIFRKTVHVDAEHLALVDKTESVGYDHLAFPGRIGPASP